MIKSFGCSGENPHPIMKEKYMSISKQGIWIDCKALLPLSYQLNNVLSNKDRLIVEDKLVKSNLAMIESFAMAYHRADEKAVYDDGSVVYEGMIKGCKQI